MPIQDSDLLLIEDTSGVSKKIAASKLKANLAANTYNNYKLLVNKPDYSSRFVYAQNMQASVAPADYMLVERAGVSYKVNGQQIIDYFPSVPAGAAGAIVDVAPAVEVSGWDQSQDWQANTVLTNTVPPKNIDRAFDGSITTWSIAQPGPGYATLTANPVIPCSKITVLVRSSNPGTHSANEFQINGIGVGLQVPEGYQEETYIEISATEFTSVYWSAGQWAGVGVDLAAVWVDDKMLVLPSISNPPISYDQQLTLASDANLDLFTPGDAIAMVNSDGDVASYTPVTSTISNVGLAPLWPAQDFAADATAVSGTGDSMGTNYADFFDGSTTTGLTITSSSSLSATYRFNFLEPIYAGSLTIYGAQNAGRDPQKGQITLLNKDGTGFVATGPQTMSQTDGYTVTWSGGPRYVYGINLYIASGRNDVVFTWYGASEGADFLINNVAGPSRGTPLLTFASPNPDLKFFNTGDVVQGAAIPSQIYSANPGTDWIPYGNNPVYGAAQAFSGSTQNNAQSQQPRATLAFTDFPVGKIGLIVDSGALDDPIVYYEINGTQVTSGNTTSSNWVTGGKILYEYNTDVALTSIVQVSGNSSSSKALYGITIDGNILIDGQEVDLGAVQVVSTDTAANTMVVDGGAWTYSGRLVSDNGLYFGDHTPDKAFNGDNSNYCTASTNTTASSLTFDATDLNISGSIKVLSTQDCLIEVVHSGGTASKSATSNSTPEDFGTLTGVTSIVIKGGLGGSNNAQLTYIEVNGSQLSNEILPIPVTGPTKSGTGNFVDSTGAVVDVTNSNQQWISNDNRLGESFFIKSASTRTGLAILRTQAIQSAQTWQAALAPYPLRSIVIYEGNYYVNSGFAPPDVDRWLDLGPI